MWSRFSQMYPPRPAFAEEQTPDLSGKVYIVTGSNTGVGKELARILYAKGAKVYVAARSEDKARAAIDEIKARHPEAGAGGACGALVFLKLDLSDLSTIKASADAFLAAEARLDVLFNNAGVMNPPAGSKTAQGYELQLGTNNVGTFLFTQLLTPQLVSTAKNTSSPAEAGSAGSVRVVWVSSSAAEVFSPPGGVDMTNLDYKRDKHGFHKYGVSKAGNYLHATEYTRRHRADGVVSVALNPGNLDSDLYRENGGLARQVLRMVALYPPVYGAYTELFAGLSPEVGLERSGDWIVPWGRFMDIRSDLVESSKPKSEGGTGVAEEFWEWCEEQIKDYV